METTTQQHETYTDIEDYEKNSYLFSPSISRRRTVKGKTYYVRRFFRGGQDFEKTMERLAVQQTHKDKR